MWDEVGQALRLSTIKMLSQLASLVPGIAALMTALLVSLLIAWAVSAILRRSLAGFEFDHRVARWGFPALAEWSPSSSPTLLVTRVIAWIIILIGFLIGISAFDGALPSQFVGRLFAYLPEVMAAVVVLAVLLRWRSLLRGRRLRLPQGLSSKWNKSQAKSPIGIQ